ncbi:MAG: hypothetical protein WD544_01995 [Patescibacteria group bacterium]
MSHVSNKVVIADSNRQKTVKLLDETHRGTKLTSIVAEGRTSEVRRFCRHEHGLFEDDKSATGLRKFLVNDIYGGTVEKPAEQPKRPGKRAPRRRPPVEKIHLPLDEIGKEVPDDYGAPLDGKVLNF